MLPYSPSAHRLAIAISLLASLTACINDPLPDSPSPAMTTVSITGVVVDSAQAPLEGTEVQVVSGGMLRTTSTNPQGLYGFSDLTVVSGPFTVRASKPGFVAAAQTVPTPTAGMSLQVNFTLSASGGVLPWNLTGQHTLTLSADDACEMLPPSARSRTYLAMARSTSNGFFFDIFLSGASFFPHYDMMFATVTSPGLLSVPSPDDGFPVVEVLPDGSHVSFYGGATIAEWSNDVSARFGGTIGYCSAGSASANGLYRVCSGQYVECNSASHHVRLTRQ